MAFSRDGLYQVGPGGNSPRLWMYSSTDAFSTIRAADYFLGAINEISLNDVILVVSATGGTPVVTLTYCNANDGTTIDVVDGNTVSATDT